MGKLEAINFARKIVELTDEMEEVTHYDVTIIDNLIVKIRIHLTKIGFIDVFYNADTQTTAYALIERERRIFGADNNGGWHIHPLENPESHQLSKEISFKEFIATIREKLFRAQGK